MTNGNKIWLVTGFVDYCSDDKAEQFNLGVFSTEQKAQERAEKAAQEKDVLGHKNFDWIDIEEMILDEELE